MKRVERDELILSILLFVGAIMLFLVFVFIAQLFGPIFMGD